MGFNPYKLPVNQIFYFRQSGNGCEYPHPLKYVPFHLMDKSRQDIEKNNFKQRLLQHCIGLIGQRINSNMAAIANAQEAANSEEKSSAGDKYETSRAMSHLEKDMHSRQLAANRAELGALQQVTISGLPGVAGTGCVVDCLDVIFFIAAGLGKIDFEGRTAYLLSPKAPIAQLLKGKRSGDSIFFNKKSFLVSAVY